MPTPSQLFQAPWHPTLYKPLRPPPPAPRPSRPLVRQPIVITRPRPWWSTLRLPRRRSSRDPVMFLLGGVTVGVGCALWKSGDGKRSEGEGLGDATDKKLLDDLRSRIEALEASSCDQHDFDSTGTVQEVTSLSSLYPEGTLIDLEKLTCTSSAMDDDEAGGSVREEYTRLRMWQSMGQKQESLWSGAESG